MGALSARDLADVADRADVWEEEGAEPSSFRGQDLANRGGEPPPLSRRRRAVYHRPIRSVVRAELASVRDLPVGFDEEE